MRQRNKPWAKEKLHEYKDIVISEPENQKGNWHEIFNNNNPIYIEVGTGKGQFISQMAKKNPDGNFIGIELSASVIVTALDKVLETEVENVRLLNVNAEKLTDYFSESEISRVFLNFSDPWPKNRHEKRRLMYSDFLSVYETILKPEGEVHFKTDNQALFEYSIYSFSNYGMIIKNVSLDLHKSDFENNVMTEYEEKFSEKGNRIYRCEAQFRNKAR
ncbi:tRNA (guanosine(46)-N7)-methyltransferase TrmB [Pseudalkalibacillus caeni]|uniref:tRNA (guanine-N(7)-)-methyltransferase n=1 Tax=Exobacillus caeni TaxID=2574798 RepID=A0A5R9F5N3_9BACL|nr:tRNA (guanosine(46)-N7)-methyltransferase TrmB [Pseudalkalibacillus caeni]TLS39062.1 tRNA (guanosine(46)-N7)-methyltransferase TrmB [Pseudalkalibacillus caeni]